MALFSVWDWDKNAWAIYRNNDTVSVGDDPKAPKPSGTSALGADPTRTSSRFPATPSSLATAMWHEARSGDSLTCRLVSMNPAKATR